ncbi:Protein N-acetyltransferase, RimJ/RimL family [Cryptosporangium aurantiacum]|uniref:Protein N-acetyltransferase, RimJ/RimL family n=1 Tax=Cryptosporangium aurantiacum TaxID=134849 RepID=A0A1M7N4P2_9ACTN|nr:Protein N-acetyltransferase, RimJ/RimL family [Cryptosporangium aurantiacum]
MRRIRPSEWPELRRLRLEALKDSPLAFVEQYDDALALPDDAWQERAQSTAAGTSGARFVATDPSGRFVGMAGIFRETDILDHVSAMLVGVYVTPTYRGRSLGTAAAVTRAAVNWALAEVAPDRIRLFVLDVNDRAKAFYRRVGFIQTGNTMRYPPDPSYLELEMAYARGGIHGSSSVGSETADST